MLVHREMFNSITGVTYPCSISEFRELVTSLGGGGSIRAMVHYVNCYARTNNIKFELDYSISHKLVYKKGSI